MQNVTAIRVQEPMVINSVASTLTHVCSTDLVGGKWMLENFFEAMDEPNEW
eukprot:COSAG02_NODE_1894_length_10475_cov_10.204125_11_plen_51_part_00